MGQYVVKQAHLYRREATKTFLNMHQPYECGFTPMSSIRGQFSLRLIQIAVFFLIFEVELFVLLSFPLSRWSYLNAECVLLFFYVVVGGLYYEARQGALNWPR